LPEGNDLKKGLISGRRKVIAAKHGSRGFAGYRDQNPRELCDTGEFASQRIRTGYEPTA